MRQKSQRCQTKINIYHIKSKFTKPILHEHTNTYEIKSIYIYIYIIDIHSTHTYSILCGQKLYFGSQLIIYQH